MRFLIIIEETTSGYSAYSPDLPGCVSTGATTEDARHNMRQAIELHIDGLRAEGLPIPPPTTTSSYVEVAA